MRLSLLRAAGILILLTAGELSAQGPPLPLTEGRRLQGLARGLQEERRLEVQIRVEWWERTVATRATAGRNETILDWKVEQEPSAEDGTRERWSLEALRFDVLNEFGRRRRFDSRHLDHYERPPDAWLTVLEHMKATPLVVERDARGGCRAIDGLEAFLGERGELASLLHTLERWLRLACLERPPLGSTVEVRWDAPLAIEVGSPQGFLLLEGREGYRVRRLFRDEFEIEGILDLEEVEPPALDGLPFREARRRARFDHVQGHVPFQRFEVEFGDGTREHRQVIEITRATPGRERAQPGKRSRLGLRQRRSSHAWGVPSRMHALVGSLLFPWT